MNQSFLFVIFYPFYCRILHTPHFTFYYFSFGLLFLGCMSNNINPKILLILGKFSRFNPILEKFSLENFKNTHCRSFSFSFSFQIRIHRCRHADIYCFSISLYKKHIWILFSSFVRRCLSFGLKLPYFWNNISNLLYI